MKGLVLRLIEVLCHNFAFKIFLVVHLEGPTAHGPADNVGKSLALGIFQNVVQLPRKSGNASRSRLAEQFGSWSRRRSHGGWLRRQTWLRMVIHGGVEHLDLMTRVLVWGGHDIMCVLENDRDEEEARR